MPKQSLIRAASLSNQAITAKSECIFLQLDYFSGLTFYNIYPDGSTKSMAQNHQQEKV